MPLAMLNLQLQPDKSWRWTAYDDHGQTMGTQDKCEDVGQALENALTWLYPAPLDASASEAGAQQHTAVQRPRSRKPQKRASSRGHK